MSDDPESPKTVKAAATEEYNEDEDGDDGGFGDDFDDFEEGEEDAEFGDFDDGFQEPEAAPPPQQIPVPPSFVSSDLHSLDSNITTSNETILPVSLRLNKPRNPRRNPYRNRTVP
jgi:hypothetical protein